MPFIKKEDLHEITNKGLEKYISKVHSAILENFGDDVKVLSTHQGHAYIYDNNGGIKKVLLKEDNDSVIIESSEIYKGIPLIEDEDLPKYVSKSLNEMVKEIIKGNDMRNQFRSIMLLIDESEEYWFSDIYEQIEENTKDSIWHSVFEDKEETIRKSLYGSIRAIEGGVPSTKYFEIAPSRLSSVTEELLESVQELQKNLKVIIDECKNMVFNEEDGPIKDICDSLIVEAEGLKPLLYKAAKLVKPKDIILMAEMHDNIANRVKKMRIMSRYISKTYTTMNEE